jgi:polar amino acid transport system substrate-binding protein
MARVARLLVLALVAGVAAGVLAGCGSDDGEDLGLEPQVEPPVIAEAGLLRVGVDEDYPPFAGEDGGRVVGIDVDVASAIAERLGLEIELVDTPAEDVAAKLEAGDIDVALAALPITQAVLADVSFAGSYMTNGPAFFSATETTETVSTLAGKRVGVQDGSMAYWMLAGLYGEDAVITYPLLKDAIVDADGGNLDLVAGDAAVAAYIVRDYPSLRFVEQIGYADPLGVAIAKDADELEDIVRATLDELASDGTLSTIRVKWLGDLPELATAPLSEDLTSSVEATAGDEATGTDESDGTEVSE